MLVTTIMVIFSCFIIPSCVMSRCFPSPVIAMISFTCPWLSSRVSGPCDFRLSYVFPPCSLVTWVQSVIPPCVFKSPSSWLSLWVCLFMFSPPPSPCSLCSFLCSQCFLLVFLYVCTSLVLRSAPACFCVFVFVSYILAFLDFVLGPQLCYWSSPFVVFSQPCPVLRLVITTRFIISLRRLLFMP